jgi:hypothetical protein
VFIGSGNFKCHIMCWTLNCFCKLRKTEHFILK